MADRPCGCKDAWHNLVKCPHSRSRATQWRKRRRLASDEDQAHRQAHQDQGDHQDHRDQDRAPRDVTVSAEACHGSAGTVWSDAAASGSMTLPTITVEALILIGLAITVLHSLTNGASADVWAMACIMLPHPNKAPTVVEFGHVLRDLSSRMAPLKIHMCIHECKVYREGDDASTCIICQHARFFRKKLPYHVLMRTPDF